jgi:hypothetical protein
MKFDSKILKASLRQELFWDVDIDKLDMDTHAAFVITRVMERGTREEARTIWAHYGEEIIKKHLTAARGLSPKTISYFANIFKIGRSQFRSSFDGNRERTWP